MTDNDENWRSALTYLAAQNDAPSAARTAAREAVSLYDKASTFYERERLNRKEQRTALAEAERKLFPDLLQQLKTAKRVNLAGSCDHIDAMRDLVKRCERDEHAARRVFSSVAADLRGNCLNGHRDSLLQWIAQRRNSEPTAFGNIDAIPTQVHFLYDKINADWQQPWDEGLTMHEHKRLLLTYSDTFTAPFRASHTWLWAQVAAGEVERLRNGKLRPMRQVLQLPEVPAGNPPKRDR